MSRVVLVFVPTAVVVTKTPAIGCRRRAFELRSHCSGRPKEVVGELRNGAPVVEALRLDKLKVDRN